MRILGIDFGERRTGVAISDPLGWTAQGLEAVIGGMGEVVRRIGQLVQHYGVEKIVVGYPIKMNGSAGYRTERTDEFISALACCIGWNTGDITKWDERLTSVEAAKALKEAGVKPTSKKERESGRLDIISSVLLLQSYLDSGRADNRYVDSRCDDSKNVDSRHVDSKNDDSRHVESRRADSKRDDSRQE